MRLLQLKKLLWILPFFFLSACGGSDDDSGKPPVSNPSGDGDPKQPPVVQLPPECEGVGNLADQIAAGKGGKAENPLLVCSLENLEQMRAVGSGYGKYVKLMVDLAIPGEHVPIGVSGENYRIDFDGNGHTISYKTLNPQVKYQGLFGVIFHGSIANLKVKGEVNATMYGEAGGVVGRFEAGSIKNVVFEGAVQCIGYECGGIAGYMHGSMDNVRVDANIKCITSSSNQLGYTCKAGAIAGHGYVGGNVNSSYATGELYVHACSQTTGGLVGRLWAAHVDGSVNLLKSMVVKTYTQSDEGYVCNAADKYPIYGGAGSQPSLGSWSAGNNYYRDDLINFSHESDFVFQLPSQHASHSVPFADTQSEAWWVATLGWGGTGCIETSSCPNVWGGAQADASKPWKWSNTLKRPVLWFEE